MALFRSSAGMVYENLLSVLNRRHLQAQANNRALNRKLSATRKFRHATHSLWIKGLRVKPVNVVDLAPSTLSTVFVKALVVVVS